MAGSERSDLALTSHPPAGAAGEGVIQEGGPAAPAPSVTWNGLALRSRRGNTTRFAPDPGVILNEGFAPSENLSLGQRKEGINTVHNRPKEPPNRRLHVFPRVSISLA